MRVLTLLVIIEYMTFIKNGTAIVLLQEMKDRKISFKLGVIC